MPGASLPQRRAHAFLRKRAQPRRATTNRTLRRTGGAPRRDGTALKISGDADRYDAPRGNDDYSQQGAFSLTRGQRQRLFANIAEAMDGVPQFIIDRLRPTSTASSRLRRRRAGCSCAPGRTVAETVGASWSGLRRTLRRRGRGIVARGSSPGSSVLLGAPAFGRNLQAGPTNITIGSTLVHGCTVPGP